MPETIEIQVPDEVAANFHEYCANSQQSKREAAGILLAHGLDHVGDA